MKAVLLTGHFPQNKRRASMLWLMEGLLDMGWEVTVITCEYSWLSRLTNDRRIAALSAPPEVGVHHPKPGLTAVFGYAPLHPSGQMPPGLTRLAAAPFRAYWQSHLRRHVPDADLIVLESGLPLLLAPQVRRLAPEVPMVYRVNDDVRLLGCHPMVAEAEMRHLSLFDRISLASPILASRFATHPGLEIDPVGVPHKLLLQPYQDPYGRRHDIEAVTAGTTLINLEMLEEITVLRPFWRVHVLGRLKAAPANPPKNLILHGEVPFETTLAHIAHADVGLAAYRETSGMEYQIHNSNRMLLYRHFGLPILGPSRLQHSSLKRFVGWSEDLEVALTEVAALGRGAGEAVPDWQDMVARIVSTQRAGQTIRALSA